MALKVLMLRKRLTDKQQELDALKRAAESFSTREAELAEAIEEASTEEEKQTVETAVEAFEEEKSQNAGDQAKLSGEIETIENEIRDLEEKGKNPLPANAENPAEPEKRDKGVHHTMETRKFFGMSAQERDAFFANTEVKEFLQRVRQAGRERRAVTGADLLIPEVMLGLLRDNTMRYSKLISKVNLQRVGGKARQNIMGTIPEGIWMEMCDALKELELSFNQIEVDGYKVGGYIAICNATLEDSDIALASVILDSLGQAIGLALDKAILYGTGTKMPIGIMTRLAQTTDPGNRGASAPKWTDLHTSNLLKVDGTTLKEAPFYSALLKTAFVAKSNYSDGRKFWAMASSTYADIMSKSIVANMSGAFVASVGQTMPIIGGDIVLLDFIPDGDIIGGYGSLYLLAERAGTTLAQSEHVRFIEDQTVFKGTARYDGTPVFGEGFVGINIKNAAPTTTMTFAGQEEDGEEST